MSEVTQTILHGDPDGRTGNCLQAAVASLLDHDLDTVPHFAEQHDWIGAMCEWANAHGYSVSYQLTADQVDLGIAYGPSPRGITHAVVVRQGALAWDPHPSRDGLASVSGVFEFTQPSRAPTGNQAHQQPSEVTMQTPSLGRIVLVPVAKDGNNGSGIAPAIITRVWSDTMINVRILLDGSATPWRTSLGYAENLDDFAGTDTCTWAWPPRV